MPRKTAGGLTFTQIGTKRFNEAAARCRGKPHAVGQAGLVAVLLQ